MLIIISFLKKIFFSRKLEYFVLFFILFIHIYKIGSLPLGLYIDEVSIGYNAAQIAQTGYDEHNEFYPLYFKAFGEYKNPVYVYTTALIFKLFGVSEFNLRFTSFIYFSIFLIAGYIFIRKAFEKSKVLSLYFILAAGMLPWFFTISRISFEVISQISFLMLSTLFLYETFKKSSKRSILLASITGLLIGLTTYTYSTARIQTFIFLTILFFVYFERKYLKRLFVLILTFSISLIPYLSFLFTNYNVFTSRFQLLSYIYDQNIGIKNKILLFIQSYLKHISFNFLLFNGDINFRHAIGFGGEIQIAVFILFIVGLLYLVVEKRIIKDKFILLLGTNFIFSPVASALTIETPHALRSTTEGFFILLISCYGVWYLLKKQNNLAITTLIIILLIQNLYYVSFYFTKYVPLSVDAFDNFNYKQSIKDAYSVKPKIVYLYNIPTVLNKFYNNLIPAPNDIKVVYLDSIPTTKIDFSSSCVVFPKKDESTIHVYLTKKYSFYKMNNLIGVECFN